LDDVLEALGAQPVPPEFHETSADSSLFGSQNLSAEEHKEGPSLKNIDRNHSANRSTPTTPLRTASGHSPSNGRLSLSPVSPSATLRRNGYARKEGEHEYGRGKADQSPASKGKISKDRKKWKTLRDFVDDQAIEDILEMIDRDRAALDVRALFRNLALINTDETIHT
jgi:autophagy-related protein 17